MRQLAGEDPLASSGDPSWVTLLASGRQLQPLAAVVGLLCAIALLTGPELASADENYAEAMAREHAGDTASASPAAKQAATQAVEGEDVVYATIAGREITGYLARPSANPSQQRPGIIVIHEWWGLNDNIRSLTRQLAGEGYTALAVDLYGGEQGQTPAAARALMQTALAAPEQMLNNLRQAHSHLIAQGAKRTGSIGWCFGGGLSLEAGLLLGDEIHAVVMYYGRPVSERERLQSLQAPLLGLFGQEDGGIPVAGVRLLETRLAELGKTASIVIYPGAGHAFANPSGSRYQADAAKDAWMRTLAFFEKHLKQ